MGNIQPKEFASHKGADGEEPMVIQSGGRWLSDAVEVDLRGQYGRLTMGVNVGGMS